MATLRQPDRRYQHQSTTWLLGGVVTDVRDLVAMEIKAFQIEMKRELGYVRRAVTMAVVAGVVAMLGAVALVFACTYLLALTALPLWAGFLIVGGPLVIAGAVLLVLARRQVERVELPPHETVQQLRGDIEWIKTQVRTSSEAR